MADENDLKKDRLFEDALKTYLDHHDMTDLESGTRPDREMSKITLGAPPTVVLQSRDGVPLGTVTWYGESNPSFEPPTKLTVVDHFQGLRPAKP